MKAYTLKKKEETEEYHLFEGNLLGIKKFDTNLVKESICKMMSIDENDGNIFTCEDKDQARLKIAFNEITNKIWQKLEWIIVYSTMDVLASNFRKDNKVGKAKYGIMGRKEVPINLNYEIARREKYNIFSFLTLKHITMHQSYWDDSKSGQSCKILIFKKMKELNYFSITT